MTTSLTRLDARYAMFNSSDMLSSVHSGQYLNVGWRPCGADGPGTELLVRLLADAPAAPSTILDVGCGRAAATAWMAARWPAAKVVGLDRSAELLASTRTGPTLGLAQADAVALPIADASMDLVTCIEAALHFDRRADFFAQAYRVLRPGARLLLTDLLVDSAAGDWPGFAGPANLECDLAEYTRTLRESGLLVRHIADVTSHTWLPYTRDLVDAAEERSASGAVAMTWALRRHPVLGYLMAVAEKPL